MNDRKQIVVWYQNGYAIKKIADTLRLKTPTIQYHLKIAGAFVPNKKPTKWGEEIKVNRPQIQPNRSLFTQTQQTTVINIGSKLYVFPTEEDALTFKMAQTFPKTYVEYLTQAKKRDISYRFYKPKSYDDRTR